MGLENVSCWSVIAEDAPKAEPKFLVDVLINSAPKRNGKSRLTAVEPISIDEPGEPVVAGVPLSQVQSIFLVMISPILGFSLCSSPLKPKRYFCGRGS